MAAARIHADAHGSSLSVERGTASGQVPPALRPRSKMVHKQSLPPTQATVQGDPAAPPLCHCVEVRRGARKAPPRPFSTVSQVARPRRTPQKQASILYRPLARGESGGRLSCLSRSGAQQATPSVALCSTRGLPGPRAPLKRHRAPCATCGARSAVHGGRPIECVAGEVHSESASVQ